MFFVVKRHWPEFGFCGLEALGYTGIITMFLWRRLPFSHIWAEVFLEHVTVLAVIFSVISLFSRYRYLFQTTVGGA